MFKWLEQVCTPCQLLPTVANSSCCTCGRLSGCCFSLYIPRIRCGLHTASHMHVTIGQHPVRCGSLVFSITSKHQLTMLFTSVNLSTVVCLHLYIYCRSKMLILMACHWNFSPENIGPRTNFSAKLLVSGPIFSEKIGSTLKMYVPLY